MAAGSSSEIGNNDDTNDRKDVAKPSQSNPELSLLSLLGGSVAERLTSKSITNDRAFQSDAGKPLGESESGPRVRCESTLNGRKVLIYADKDAALDRKPAAVINFTYKDFGNTTTEVRSVFGSDQQKSPMLTTETTLNRKDQSVTIKTTLGDKTTTASYGDGGQPTNLQIKNEQTGQAFSFEMKEGRIVGVVRKESNGTEESLKGEKLDRAVRAGENALNNMAKENGLSQPFARGESRAEKIPTLKNQPETEAEMIARLIDHLTEAGWGGRGEAGTQSEAIGLDPQEVEDWKGLIDRLSLVSGDMDNEQQPALKAPDVQPSEILPAAAGTGVESTASKAPKTTSDQSLTESNEFALSRDSKNRISHVRQGENTIAIKYDGDSQESSGFEILGKDGKSLKPPIKHDGPFRIDEKTGNITVGERTGGLRSERVYSPDGSIRANEYDDKGLRTKQTLTTREQDGSQQKLTTDYRYASENGSLKVEAVQTDEKSRVTERSLYASATAVEAGKPCISERVSYQTKNNESVETQKVTDLSNRDRPKTLSETVKTTNGSGEISIRTNLDLNGVETKVSMDFNADGKATSFTREQGKDKYSFSIEPSTGKLTGVKLNDQPISDQKLAETFLRHGQIAVDSATVQHGIRSAEDRARRDFLNPESSSTVRADAMEQLKQQALTKTGHEKTALERTVQTYEAINLGAKIVSLAGNEIKGEVAQFAKEAGQAAGSEKSLAGMAQIADGRGGDKEQTRAARDALLKLAADSPETREKIVQALAGSGDSSTTHSGGALEILGKVASMDKNTSLPPEVKQALVRGLESSSPQRQQDAIRGLDQLLASGQLSARQYTDAVKNHMTPAVTREMQALPKALLDKDNLRAELMNNLDSKLKNSNVKGLEREHAIEAMVALGGTKALLAQATAYGLSTGISGEDSTLVEDNRARSRLSFDKFGDSEKLGHVYRGENGSSYVNWYDPSGKFKGTRETQHNLGDLERNENYEVKKVSPATGVNVSDVKGESQFESPVLRSKETPTQNTSKALQDLQSMAGKYPPDAQSKQAEQLLSAFGSNHQAANERVNQLLLDLNSDNTTKQGQAMKDIQSTLGPTIEKTRVEATKERILQGMGPNSGLTELVKDQADLAKLAAVGDKDAERMLYWTEAMKSVAQLRDQAATPAGNDVQMQRDVQGRIHEIRKDGVTIKLGYKDDVGKQPSSVELLNKSGESVAKHEGQISVDSKTGEVSFSRRLGDKNNLERMDVKYSPGGKIEGNQYDANGLRTQQTLSELQSNGEMKNATTAYSYRGADGKPTDNPLKVASAIATTADVESKEPSRIQKFNSFAAVELNLPSVLQTIERKQSEISKSETLTITDARDPAKPQVVGKISIETDFTGERTVTETGTDEKTSQKVRFDSGGTVNNFARTVGDDKFSYEVNSKGQVSRVFKNNTEVEGETGNALKNEGRKLLEAMTQQYGIGSKLDAARADFLNPEASAQAKAQAIEHISEEARLKHGDARTALENTVQSYKAIALAGEVVSLAGNDIKKEVAKVSQEAGQIVGFENAVDRLAQIASGSGGDKEQTSKAQAALVKIATESPDKRERIMNALVKSCDKSSGSVAGVLDTLGKVAALDKNSAAPLAVTQAILRGLDAKSPVNQLDSIRGLNQLLVSDRLSSKEYLEAVKGHMTPAVVREVKDLPKDVLDGKNLRAELMADLSTKLMDSNLKGREREQAIEAMAALGGSTALQEKASEYGVKLDAAAGSKKSVIDTRTGSVYSFQKHGEDEKLVRVTRSENGSYSGFTKNLYDDQSGKFIGTSEFQKDRGVVERNENLEVTKISTAKDISPSELLDKSERKMDGPGDRAAAELERLAAMTIGNKTAGELYGRLGGFSEVENLKLRLKSEDNSVRNAAMDELKHKLSGAINEQVNNHRTAVSVNGVNQDSSFADFSKIQPALIRETQAGNKSAEKWLNWSQGMKHAEQIRQAELAAKVPGVTIASDPSGRAMEVKSGGVSTTFKYEASSKVPSSVEIKRPGSDKSEVIQVRGDLKVDERTGDITVVNRVDGGVGPARVETSISADGKVHTTTYDTDGRPVQLQKGDTTTRLNYREDNNSLSSLDITKLNAQGKPTTEKIDLSHVKIKVPNDNISGEFVERRVKSDGPAKFDPRTGDISISQRSGGDSSLSRMDVKISPDGKVAASVYDTGGMRTSQTVTEVGQNKPESTIKYTYVGENGKLADNPLAIKVVMAEKSNSDNEIVERNMFYSFAAVETNKPALRETIEKQAEKNSQSVEIHRFEDVSDPTNVQRVGEVKRIQDSITNAVTIESAMLKDGVKLYEKATFSGTGKPESYSREGAYTAKYNYTIANGRITEVKGTNLTEIGDQRDSSNPETQKAMRAEGEALLQQMQSLYKIDNTHDLEGLKPTGWVKDQRPASGTLIIKDQSDQQNGGYESLTVAAGKIRGRDGTEIGKLTNDGLVQFSDGRKPDRFNICDTEGAAFHGTAGEGSDRIRIDMVSRQQENGFTGLLTESPGGKEFKVIGGNIFDGNKFVGHLDQNGRVHSDTGGGAANPPQWLNQFKRNARFEGTEDGKPRVMDLTSSAPNGKMFIPDAETGRLVEHEVRMGMVIDKHTGQQLGRLEPPSPNADKSLSGGELTLMNGEKINLSDLTRASFSLTKPGVQGGAREHEKIEGLCLGPQARLANGEPNPNAGGLLSLSKARESNNQMLQVAWNEVAKYRQSGDFARGWQVITGVSDSTQQTIRHQVNTHQEMHARAEGDLKAISEGRYDDATIKQLQDRTLVREIIAGRENLGLKRQQLDAAPTNFESLPADPTKIRGSVTVPTMDSTGKVIGKQEYPVVGGAIVGPDGNPLGRIENLVDKSTGRLVQQGVLDMPDLRNPGKQLKTMGDLEGAVWKLDVPGQAPGQTQRLNWISVGGEKGIASAQALTRDARKETEYASAANRILQSDKSKDAVKESVEKYDAYVSRVNEIVQKGVQSKEDLDFLKRGPKEQVAADAYKPEANRPPRIARAELPADMKDVEGRLRMGDKVFEVKDGKLIDQVSKLPIGEIQSGYKVKFNDGRQVNLNTEPGVLMQWKGADGQTHNLIGLGPGATIKNFGWQQGGLVDVKHLKEQAAEIQKEAAGHNKKYLEERPWITGAMGNAWMGDPEKAMGDLNATLGKYQRDLDRTVALYFGTGDSAGKYGGDYNASKPPDGFNPDLFNKGAYKREGSPGEVNVSSQSLCSRGDSVQILIATMGSTAQDLGELSREAAQVQQQIADSVETAAVTVATAGAGVYFAAAARAGQMSRGAATLWQVGAGVGFGGSASVLSMSDKSDGLAHVASGSIKGLAMSVPGAVSTLRLASGTGQAANAVVQVEQVAVANATGGLARFGAKTLDYSGRALGAVEKVPGVTTVANSVFQSTMFAAADWAKDGFKIDKLGKHFDPTKLGVSAGAMFFAHGAGKALGQSSDKLGERVGKVVAGTEKGQAVLASRAGQRIFGSEVDQATGKASLWAIKQNEQKLVSGVINGMSNAYAFGAAGASHEAIQGEKARVAEKLGLMKRDKEGNLVPNEDMVGTGSSMFSFQNVLGTMHEAGLSAMATLGPLAYPSHKVTQHLVKGVEARAAAERKAAAQQSGSNVPRESLEQSASYLDARAKDLQQRREELQRKPDMPGQEKLLAQADKQIQENDRQRLANKAEQLDRLLQPWAAEIVPRQQKQQELIKGLVDQGIVKFGDQGKPELQVQPAELSTKQRKDLATIGELQTELDVLAKLMDSRGVTAKFDTINKEVGRLKSSLVDRLDSASRVLVDERPRTEAPLSVESANKAREAINQLASEGKPGHALQLADFARSLDLSKPDQKQLALDAIKAAEKIGERNRSESGRTLVDDPRPAQAMVDLAKASGDKDVAASALKAAGKLGDIQHMPQLLDAARSFMNRDAGGDAGLTARNQEVALEALRQASKLGGAQNARSQLIELAKSVNDKKLAGKVMEAIAETHAGGRISNSTLGKLTSGDSAVSQLAKAENRQRQVQYQAEEQQTLAQLKQERAELEKAERLKASEDERRKAEEATTEKAAAEEQARLEAAARLPVNEHLVPSKQLSVENAKEALAALGKDGTPAHIHQIGEFLKSLDLSKPDQIELAKVGLKAADQIAERDRRDNPHMFAKDSNPANQMLELATTLTSPDLQGQALRVAGKLGDIQHLQPILEVTNKPALDQMVKLEALRAADHVGGHVNARQGMLEIAKSVTDPTIAKDLMKSLRQTYGSGEIHARDLEALSQLKSPVGELASRELADREAVRRGDTPRRGEISHEFRDGAVKKEAPPEAVAEQKRTLDQEQKKLLEGEVQAVLAVDGTTSGHQIYQGVHIGADGKQSKVYVRTPGEEVPQGEPFDKRVQYENAARAVNEALKFGTGYPAMVERDVKIGKEGHTARAAVQQDAGIALDRAGDQLPRRPKPDEKRAFESQLEKAFIARLIMGDQDFHGHNFAVRGKGTDVVISNLDLGRGFGQHEVPKWGRDAGSMPGFTEMAQIRLAGEPLSDGTRQEIRAFVAHSKTPEGQKELRESGLTEQQQAAVVKRAEWLAENGRFPELKVRESGDTRPLEPDKPASERKPSDITDPSAFDKPPSNKAPVGNEKEPATPDKGLKLVPKEPVKHEGNNATLVGDKDGNVVRTEGGNVLIHRSDLIDNFGTILQIDPKTLENTNRYQKLDVKGPNGETYYLNKEAARQHDKERAPDSANDKYLKVVDSLPGVKEVMAAPELKEVRPDQLESRQKDVAERRSDAVEQAKKHVAELGDRLTIPERKIEKLENLKDMVQNTGETREVKEQELQDHLARMSPIERAQEFKRLGIESFEDFAALALKPESKADMAVFKAKGHDQLEILIPKDYVRVLDQVRELRQAAQDSPAEATRKLDELRQKAADSSSGAERVEARKILDAYDRAILPEEVVRHLKDLPDGGKLIKEIVISDKPNPGDAWHTQEYNQKKLGKTHAEFESLATADIHAGKITFHPSQDYQRNGLLPVILSHEWSHLLEAKARSRPAFDAATNLENAGGEKGKKGAFVSEYATYNNHEDWAVHLGEVFLGKGQEGTDRFAGLVQIAKESGDSKYKLLVMAKALEDVLTESERSGRKPATEEESRSREALKGRIDYLRKELGGPNDQARRELVDRLSSPTVTAEQARDLAAVLSAIGDRTHAQQLIDLSKTTKSDDVASEIVRAAGQLGGESHSNQLIELAKSTKDAISANLLLNAAADAYRNDHPVPGQDIWAGNQLPVEKLVELSKVDGPARDWALNEIVGSFNEAHRESQIKREAAREEIVQRMESGEILQLFKEGKIDGQRLLYNLSASTDAAQQKRVFDSAMKHLADAPVLRDEYLASLLQEDLPIGKLALAELGTRAPADKEAVRLLQSVADDSSHSLQQQAKGVLSASVESQAAKTAQQGEVASGPATRLSAGDQLSSERSRSAGSDNINQSVQLLLDQAKAAGDRAYSSSRAPFDARVELKKQAHDAVLQRRWPDIEKQVKDVVLLEAKRNNLISRDSQGKPGESIIKPENIKVVYERGGPQGSYDAKTNTIVVNLASAVDVASVIKHELRHARDLVERTAFFMADPSAYKARVQEEVLRDLGSALAGRRLESSGPDKYKVADRVQYNQEDSRTYAREALKDYLKSHGDKPLPSEGELHIWLQERKAKLEGQAAQGGKKAPPLSEELQEKGGLKQLAKDMCGEVDHYQNVLKHSKISDQALKANPDMAKEIERRGQGYRERAERYAEAGKTGLETNPELLKLTRGLSTETVGAVGPGTSAEYGLSPAELTARRVEAAARLKVEVQKLTEELGQGPDAPKAQLKEEFQKDSMFGPKTPYPDIKLNNHGIEMHKALDEFQKLANQTSESKPGSTPAEAARAQVAQQEAKDKAWATAQEAARKMLPLLPLDEKYSQNTVKLLYKNGLISREDVCSLAPHFEEALDKSSKK